MNIYIFFTVPNYLPFHVSLSMIHIPINFYTVRKIKLLQTGLYPIRQGYGHWSSAILTDKGNSWLHVAATHIKTLDTRPVLWSLLVLKIVKKKVKINSLKLDTNLHS